MPAQLAQALYDNAAESPEELSFRRGDVMLVLERDPPTLSGWWRCSLRGKQGIAPGNRLRLLPESEENEYQAPRHLGANIVITKPQNPEDQVKTYKDEPQTSSCTEVYQVPPIARLCISPPTLEDDIYNSPRQVEVPQPCPKEVYDMPSSLLKDTQSLSSMYDSPVLRLKEEKNEAMLPPEEIPEDIYDVPPTFQNVALDDEEDEGIYSMPSNLKRVSGLQNLYEAPEDILSCGNLPEPIDPPQTHRLSVSSTGSARSVDSGGSRESNLPSLLTRDSRTDGLCTVEALRMQHQELQRTMILVRESLQDEARRGCLENQGTVQGAEVLKDFVGLAQVVLLHSCQASDPSLHRELSGHLEQLEHALRALQEGGIEVTSLTHLIQEQSGYIVALVNTNATLLFPRPRLSSSESLSRRPLPAIPTASPAAHRKGSIQDRPLPPPPILHRTPGDPEEDAHCEYERIQCRDNHYVHLQGTNAQTTLKSKDQQKTVEQKPLQERKVDTCPEPSEEDRHLLRFYVSQSHGHLQTLQSCVNTFLGSASSQPPRVFVGHGKQLVIAAHKLVFIGDTLGRLLSCNQLQAKLAGEGGALCQALKEVVLATKEAAALYPSPVALKAMAVSVSVLCTCAHSFTDLLQKMAS
ncbi:embryonal Fyn-associated substrate [Hyla sarda]|uniref:embryonal Fyn-associated substrate n=1 Tax=Hyla sarda TaxID=327740 RepID=UPI0024C46D08|nr:embryonal Fyn-associated substrate [Hyla sarda]XP_056382349.1 embryonal Fyn-associated substrate [Hyla sarda]XP_056382359.1 embryonal Fyn-associated substrate [Hyla sarda]XP_056382369.1 embryonal Fyn-associated substrate [Hyla sarda]XP_056382377.1 embryonal Fyn-associated substrate [Hyla sarda]